ncbi:hypothetical protein EB662_06065 [Escherichia coli]|nr:hypothetical protein [Escherichia coli]
MYLTDNIIKLSNKIGQRVYTVVSEMSIEAWITKEPQPFVYRRSGAYQKLTIGSDWGQLFDCAWMRVYGKRPADKFRHKLVALVDIGGEGLIVDKNGSPSAASRIKHHLMAYRQINQVNGWLTFLSLVKMTRSSFGLMLRATIYLAMSLMEGLLLMFISRHVINY